MEKPHEECKFCKIGKAYLEGKKCGGCQFEDGMHSRSCPKFVERTPPHPTVTKFGGGKKLFKGKKKPSIMTACAKGDGF